MADREPSDFHLMDDGIPLSATDDTRQYRNVSYTACLYFETVLDSQKLHNALETLLSSSPEWRYLGGRLRWDF